jgi:Holliday junction resolvasome RuvABC endonuclease subunit|tara:strand:- start:2420 stop:2923 length:504 start_codon:yes stop_codon:yes gene_type:complete
LKILGLDASTTTVGYAFVENKKVIDIGFIPIHTEKTIRDKVKVTLDGINKLDPFDEIDKIYIEDSLSGFMRGRTSQQTIIKLAKFNAVLTYCLEFAYSEIVIGVNPMTARKNLFGKSREKGVSAKDFVKKEINCLYSLEEYVKLTKTGLWDKRNMDAYDALVCALYE